MPTTFLVTLAVCVQLSSAITVHNAASSRHPLWRNQLVYQLTNPTLLVSIARGTAASTAAVLDATHVCSLISCPWIQPSTNCNATAICFDVTMPSNGVHALAFYHLGNPSHRLIDNHPLLINVTRVLTTAVAAFVNSSKPVQVGTYWTPYFTPTTLAAIRSSQKLGRSAPNLETWIRSNGTLAADEVPLTVCTCYMYTLPWAAALSRNRNDIDA